MPIDSFKFLPRSIAQFYQMSEQRPQLPIPWTPLAKPLANCTFALITSGGLYDTRTDDSFDMEREQAEGTWGDPSFRVIPTDIKQADVGVSHLHINTEFVQQDINVLLPVTRFQELAAAGRIGGLAQNAYSFMGFQGFPPDTSEWEQTYAPQVIAQLKQAQVDAVLLTPV